MEWLPKSVFNNGDFTIRSDSCSIKVFELREYLSISFLQICLSTLSENETIDTKSNQKYRSYNTKYDTNYNGSTIFKSLDTTIVIGCINSLFNNWLIKGRYQRMTKLRICAVYNVRLMATIISSDALKGTNWDVLFKW